MAMDILRRIRDSIYVICIMFIMAGYVILMMLSTLFNVIVHGNYEINIRRDTIHDKKSGDK